MNTAVKVTLIRILLVPIFIILLIIDTWETRILALLIFILGGVTDTIDGIIARKNNTVSKLGSSLDPLADKLLITTALICLLGFKELKIPSWTVVVIVVRDYIITWIRSMEYTFSMPADKTAKVKTFLQNVAVISIMIILAFKKQIESLGIDKYVLNKYPKIVMVVVAIFTLVSGLVYIIKYRDLIIKQFEQN